MKPSRAKQTRNKGEKNNYVHSLQNTSPPEASLCHGLQSGPQGKQVPLRGAGVSMWHLRRAQVLGKSLVQPGFTWDISRTKDTARLEPGPRGPASVSRREAKSPTWSSAEAEVHLGRIERSKEVPHGRLGIARPEAGPFCEATLAGILPSESSSIPRPGTSGEQHGSERQTMAGGLSALSPHTPVSTQ